MSDPTREALDRVQDFIDVGKRGWASPDLLAALIEVHTIATEALATTPAPLDELRTATEQWVELFEAHNRGDDLGPIFNRHIQAASDAIRAALEGAPHE